MKPSPSLRPFLAGSALLAGVTATIHAAPYTWDGTAGLWSTLTAWSPDLTLALTNADDVTFDSAGVANLTTAMGSGNQVVKSITFDSLNSYTARLYSSTSTTTTARSLTTGSITVNAGNHSIFGAKGGSGTTGSLLLTSGTYSIASGSTLTFDARLRHSGTTPTYSKTGLGNLVLNAENGGTSGWVHSGFTVSQGILQFAAANAYGNSANNYSVTAGAAIELDGGFTQTNTSGTITLNGTGISGNGALRSLGGTNAINSTGSILLNAFGTNSIGVDADSLSIANVISGSSPTRDFAKVGSGTLTLSGANTYTGTTTISAGTISAANIVVSGGSSNLGNATSAVTLGSASSQGTLSYTGNSATYTRGFTIGGAGGGRLDVTTSGQTLTVDTNGVTGSGLFTVGGAGNTTINTALTHTGGLTKTGGGTLTLQGDNTFTGTTTVSEGKLIINGAHASTTLSIANGATLGGTGTIAAAVTVSGVHSPGNSPGVQPFGGDLTYDTGASVLWELVGNTTTGRGTSYDGINVGGALTFSVTTPLTLDFTYTGSTVDWASPFWDSSYIGTNGWLIYSGATSLTGFSNLQVSTSNWADGQGDLFNTELSGGSFSLFQSGNNIYLNYTAIPEPAAALLGGLGLLALLRRRR